MGKVLDWFELNKNELQQYLVEKGVSWAPEESQWVFLQEMV